MQFSVTWVFFFNKKKQKTLYFLFRPSPATNAHIAGGRPSRAIPRSTTASFDGVDAPFFDAVVVNESQTMASSSSPGELRGNCGACKKPVFSTQSRAINAAGVYFHYECCVVADDLKEPQLRAAGSDGGGAGGLGDGSDGNAPAPQQHPRRRAPRRSAPRKTDDSAKAGPGDGSNDGAVPRRFPAMSPSSRPPHNFEGAANSEIQIAEPFSVQKKTPFSFSPSSVKKATKEDGVGPEREGSCLASASPQTFASQSPAARPLNHTSPVARAFSHASPVVRAIRNPQIAILDSLREGDQSRDTTADQHTWETPNAAGGLHRERVPMDRRGFIPMEDRGQIGLFKEVCSIDGTGLPDERLVANLRTEARSYLKGELETLRSSVDLEARTKRLQTVLDQSEKVHFSSYETVMKAIVEETHFEEMVTLTNEVNARIVQEFGEKPTQRQNAADDVTVLYADGESVGDAFLRFAQGLQEKTHNKEMHVQQHPGEVFTKYLSRNGEKVKKLVLKNEARVLVKTGLQPGASGANFSCANCCDIVRAALSFESIADIKVALEIMLACDAHLEHDLDKVLLGDFARSIRVTRIKNRFADPTSGGWGDVMVNFYFEKDEHKHIVELQLMHDRMFFVRKEHGGHAAYNQSRTAAELLEALGVQRLPPRSTSPRKQRVTQEQLFELKETVDSLEIKNEVLETRNIVLEERLQSLEVQNFDLANKVSSLETKYDKLIEVLLARDVTALVSAK